MPMSETSACAGTSIAFVNTENEKLKVKNTKKIDCVHPNRTHTHTRMTHVKKELEKTKRNETKIK